MITYFGYGSNQSLVMMESIVGRAPEGERAVLEDYELLIQQPREVPVHVKKLLATHRSAAEVASFATYAIRPQPGARVDGMAWLLTPLERRLVDEWERNDGFWYEKVTVLILVRGQELEATTEMIDDPSLTPAKTLRPNLPVFLNPQARMVEVADIVRRQYLTEHVD